MSAERNISIYKGDTYVHELKIRDSSNTAISISSRQYTGQIRKTKVSSTIIATFTTTITNGSLGIMNFSLSSNITANIKSGIYFYDLQETNGSIITTLISGKVTVSGDVTRAG